MDESSSSAMEITGIIIRTSIYTFLKYFHYFSTIPILLLLPFSASALFSEALFWPQFTSVFHVAGSSGFISLLSMNFFILPFTLSSFLIGKASIVQALNPHKPSVPPTFSAVVSNCRPLIFTYLCVLIFAVNGVIFIGFNYLKAFGLSYISSTIVLPLTSLVFYSFQANIVFISNLALVVAGMDDSCKGYAAIYKACVLRKGKNSMALLLSLPTNFGIAAVEALFRYRVVQIYQFLGGFTACIALEGMLIAYLYSLLVVLDTIACCLFYKSSCDTSFSENGSDRRCDEVVVVRV